MASKFTNPPKKPSRLFVDSFNPGVMREDLIRQAEAAAKKSALNQN